MITMTFTPKEMREFLKNTGKYEIETVSVQYSYTEYHNRVVDDVREVEIAYPIEIPVNNFIANKTYSEILKWSISSVFERELKNKLLNL